MTTQELFCEKCGAANVPTALFCHHCATPLPVKHNTGTLPEQTLLLERYQLVSRIGQGGMGAVYKATDTRLDNRPVAIKEMSKAGIPSSRVEEAETAFEREARLLGKLFHPNLPRIHDHFTENDRSYLVMDFIDGETLEDFLEKHSGSPLPIEQVLSWAEQLCDVLGYLHNHQPPIIFRDLKPANVMIDDSGHLFLIDFGIARLFKPGQSHDTVALGSPGYAAPEQYGKAQSTPRSDIYSLGALLHCLLTGHDPSERPFFFRPAAEINPAVSPALEALLQRMLEMDASKRPANTLEVLQVLRNEDTKTQTTGVYRTYTFTPSKVTQYQTQYQQSSTPTGDDLLLKEAHTLYTQRRLADAERVYTQALQMNSTNPLGWQGRGLTQGLLARHTEALSSFEQALKLDPKLVVSWNGKGTALSTLQRNRDALAAFDQALKLDSSNADAWDGKGVALSALGRTNEALIAFDAALRLEPKMARAWNNKGLVLRQLRRYPEALHAHEQALNYDDKMANAWSGKASVLHDMGRLPEALDAYQQACNRNPRRASAWNGKGSVLYELALEDMGRGRQKQGNQKFELASQAFQEAIRLDRNYAPAYYGRGNVLYVQRSLQPALDMFNQAIRCNPRYLKALKRRGDVLNELGQRYEALDSYANALNVDPQFAAAWNGRAGVLCQLENYRDALTAYDSAIRYNPKFSQAWNGKGNAFFHLKNYRAALEAYGQALALQPQMVSAWHNKSLVLSKLKRYAEALEAAEQAIHLAPGDPDNWLRKAEALNNLRRKKDAKAAQSEAKRLKSTLAIR